MLCFERRHVLLQRKVGRTRPCAGGGEQTRQRDCAPDGHRQSGGTPMVSLLLVLPRVRRLTARAARRWASVGISWIIRANLKQLILSLVNDGLGSPTCTEMRPGNTADVGDCLRRSHSQGGHDARANAKAGLKTDQLDYIVGVRERNASAQQAVNRAVEGPRLGKVRADTSRRLRTVRTVGPALHDAPRPTNRASRAR